MTFVRYRGVARENLALWLGLAVATIAALALVGWSYNIAVLKNVIPGLASMKPNTAIGLLLDGVALAILSRRKVASAARFWATAMAAVVIAVGALTLSEYLIGGVLGMDQWLFQDAAPLFGTSQPGRMTPATAFCLLLAGVALWMEAQSFFMRWRLSVLAALGLALVVIGGLAFIGNVLDALFDFRWWSYTGMAIHTSAAFVLFGFGLLALGGSKSEFKWSLDALTTGGFMVGIFSLLAAAGISHHFTNLLQESAAWVSHTQEVLKEIGGITAGVASIGSSQHSFINTGDDRLLEPDEAIKEDLHRKMVFLRKLTADNPRQKPRLDQLEPLIAQRINWGEKTIEARRKEGLSAAEQMIATGKGIQLSDAIRRVIKALEDEEYFLLDQRQKKEKAISDTTFRVLPLGVFLSVTLLSLGLFFLNTGLGERAGAEEKSARLAAIVESSDDAIIGKNLQGIVTSWNAGAERLFGYQACEMVGQPIMRLIPKDRHFEEQEILRRVNRGESVQHFDTMRMRKDESMVAISVTVSPIKDSTGTIIGASKVARDITERKRAETQLRLLETCIGRLNDIVLITEAEPQEEPGPRILFVNDAFVRRTGYAREEVLGRSPRFLQGPKTSRAELDRIKSEMRQWKPVRAELLNYTKSGQEFWHEMEIVPVADATGKFTHWVAVERDFTERKNAQEALRQQAALFDQMYDAAIVWMWDGPITFWNRGAERLYGFTRAAALGRMTHELLNTQFPEGLDSALSALNQQGHWEGELEHITLEGRHITVESRMILVREPERTYVLEANRDITERKQAQEKIRQMNSELERRVAERTEQLQFANQELEAFSYSVSHDLRAPLRAVDGFSQAVLEDYGTQLPEEGREDLRTIRQGAQRMGRLIDDLLTFSRLSRLPLRRSEVNTGDLVRDVLGELNHKQEGRQINVHIAELAHCQADAALLKQVWINLLSNALKYTGKRAEAVIEIGCAREKGRNVFSVRDNGTGFDMQYAHKLFGVFQRLHRVEDYEGTGVGLAIVQRVIHRHGGRVWAESIVNRGATFYFTLTEQAEP